jgi:hypothetical protein
LNDSLHLLLQGTQVFGSKWHLDIEVVLETIGDRWTNAELGLGINRLNRLSQDMGCGMSQYVQALDRRDRNCLDRIAILRFVSQIAQFTINFHGNNGLVSEQPKAVRARLDFS